MRTLVLAVLALLPGIAMASGFYLPWWGEALIFLFFSLGWAFCAALFIALAASIWIAVKRWNRSKTP